MGRVHTLDFIKAKGNINLVVGTCFMNKQTLFVLVDNGVTHSFISNKCVHRFGFQVIPLPNLIVIYSAMDDIVQAQLVCRNCSVYFKGRELLIDFICLPLKKIDMILVIYWLSDNSVYISCKEKAIFIPAEETTPIDMIDRLVEGTINMANHLFAQEKSFLLILTMDS